MKKYRRLTLYRANRIVNGVILILIGVLLLYGVTEYYWAISLTVVALGIGFIIKACITYKIRRIR